MKKHLLLSITILGLISIGSVACIKKELIAPKFEIAKTFCIDKLIRIKNKIINSPSTVKVAWVGDSTSDLASNASSITWLWNANKTAIDKPLYGLQPNNLLDFGVSGRKLARFNNNHSDNDGFDDVVASNPDLIILSFGINDIRVNTCTANELKVLLRSCVDSLINRLPNTDIILRMPNNFLTTDPTGAGYVTTTNPSGTITYYASIAIAAQAQTDSIYKAYTEVYSENSNRWDHVELFNSMDLIFGRICPATDPILHSDQVHPTYSRIVEEVVKMIGKFPVYSQFKADSAYAIDSIAPYIHYKLAPQDTSRFELIAQGTTAGINTTRVDFNIPPSFALTGILNGDIVSVGDSYFFVKSGTLSTVTSTRTRLTQSLVPIAGLVGAQFKVYRRK